MWHALLPEEVLHDLGSGSAGLTSDEARHRLTRFGPNRFASRAPASAWQVLRRQFRSVVVWLLVVAAGLAWFIGDALEGAAIGVVLLVNVVTGFWTEWRARVAVEALRTLQVDEALVSRDGHVTPIDAADVVPGDVLMLAEGASVPADARLLSADELRLDESTLTGESMPVAKAVTPVGAADPAAVPVADRTSMVFRGSTVVGGAATAVVTATGASTEVGRIGALVQSVDHAPTPIEQRLDVLGRRLVLLTLGVAVVVVVVGLLGDRDPWLVVVTGLALAIAAVPEGLPVVATITLAAGMRRMAERNALVRRPPAVEALGSATVICSDKTGTLTTGRMAATTVVIGSRTLDVTPGAPDLMQSAALTRLVRAAVLANEGRLEAAPDGWRGVGDPTDVALLILGEHLGVPREALLATAPTVARMPFSSRRMLMASFHADQGAVRVYTKGATDRLIDRCDSVSTDAGEQPMDPAERARIRTREQELAAQGLRVLALADGRVGSGEACAEDALSGLTFLGLVGLMDPPAPLVAETVARFRAAGVRTVMITGDQPATARAIAERLGMLTEGGGVVAGGELVALDPAALAARVTEVDVFGRVSPEDKLRLVEALQARGEIVAMLGDGVNDAPALLKADIGVAMGRRGTDVAKGVADLVLADDRFETVGVAVEEGRVIFDNIRKFIFYLFACNLSEVGVVLVASLAGAPLPLLPLQLLWLNLVTDVFPALALSVEPAEPNIMRRPPRPKGAPILSRGFLFQLGVYATILTVVTLGAFFWGLRARPGEPAHAVTLAFATLAFAQLAHAFNASRFGPLRGGRALFANRWLWGAVLGAGLLQWSAVEIAALQRILGTVSLGWDAWLVVTLGALAPLVLGQAWKRAHRRRSGAVA